MKLKHFFDRILQSIRSSDFYVNVTSEKMSKALLYIFLIIFIVGSASGLIQGILSRNQLNDAITITTSDSFPDFSFSEGRFSIDLAEPIRYDFDTYYVFIVDPTNTKTINDLAGYDAGYLLQPESIYISTIGNSPVRYDLSLLSGLSFDKSDLIAYMETLSTFMIPLVIFFSIVFVLIGTLFKSLFLLLLGIMMRSMNQITTLTTASIYKMVLYSMTLGIIVTEVVALILILTPIVQIGPWISSFLPFLTFYLPSSLLLSKGMKAYKDTHSDSGSTTE